MSKTLRHLLLVILVLTFTESTLGQQLLLLKRGKVVFRFNEGDEIYFRLKDDRQRLHSHIMSVREFYFVTTNYDTLQYARVASLDFMNENKRKLGVTMTLSGLGLLAVYGLNTFAFDQNTPSMRGLRFVAFTGIVIGTILYFRSDRQVILNGKRRLKYASYDSPLYR